MGVKLRYKTVLSRCRKERRANIYLSGVSTAASILCCNEL